MREEIDPLVWLVESGDLSGLRRRLSKESIEQAKLSELLAYAVIHKQPTILDYLLELGADPNVDVYNDGRNALHWVAFGQHREMMESLVNAGARVVSESNYEPDTAMHAAADKGDSQALRYLVEHAGGREAFLIFDVCDCCPLHCAVRSGKVDAVETLLELGIDPNSLVQVHHDDRIGWTALSDAVRNGHYEICKTMLEHGADPDRPGWMWTTARDAMEDLESLEREKFAELLAVRPLKKLKDSAHAAEVKRQLQDDLVFHGFTGHSIGWRGSRRVGETVQVRGEGLAGFENIRIVDSQGEIVGRGTFGFLVLTVDLDFRVFWTELKVDDRVLRADEGQIPAHIWNALTEKQKSWLVSDCRNGNWRDKESGYLSVEGLGSYF